MGEVVILDVQTKLDIPAECVLTAAVAAELKGAIVVGIDAEGNEYFASSVADHAQIVWLLERFKHVLMTKADD